MGFWKFHVLGDKICFEIFLCSLLGMETREQAVAERCTVRTRRGAEVVMIEIPCTN